MERFYKYVIFALIEKHKADGWEIADSMSGTHHGFYSQLLVHYNLNTKE